MFRKITGIIGVLLVVGVIVMTALSPRKKGFFPDALDFLKRDAPTAVPASAPDALDVPSGTINTNELPTEPIPVEEATSPTTDHADHTDHTTDDQPTDTLSVE